MDRNLGASQVATGSTDTLAYGDLYQWGRGTDGHEKRTSATTTALSSSDVPGHSSFILAPNSPLDWRSPQNADLWQDVNGINNPCPTGFRLPTGTEWETELINWSSNNSAGAYASPLKLVMAGSRQGTDGQLRTVGNNGHYWSSTVNNTASRGLSYWSGNADILTHSRSYGYSVRCIED